MSSLRMSCILHMSCNLVSPVTNFISPAYNEFGYNEHPAITSRFHYIKIIDGNVKKFGCNCCILDRLESIF